MKPIHIISVYQEKLFVQVCADSLSKQILFAVFFKNAKNNFEYKSLVNKTHQVFLSDDVEILLSKNLNLSEFELDQIWYAINKASDIAASGYLDSYGILRVDVVNNSSETTKDLYSKLLQNFENTNIVMEINNPDDFHLLYMDPETGIIFPELLSSEKLRYN